MRVGKDVASGKTTAWRLADRQNSHLLVFGESGTGKTTVLNNVIAGSHDQGAVVVFVDPKTEWSELSTLAAKHHMTCVTVRSCLPWNPLDFPGLYQTGPNKAASELADVFTDGCGLSKGEGYLLKDLIEKAYEMAGWRNGYQGSTGAIPRWENLTLLLETAQENPNARRLGMKLGQVLSAPGPFNLRELGKTGAVLGLKDCTDSLKKVSTALLFASSYQHACFGRDEYTVLVLDEAHRFGGLRILETISREGRDFNTALVLSTQGEQDVGEDVAKNMRKLQTIRWGELREHLDAVA